MAVFGVGHLYLGAIGAIGATVLGAAFTGLYVVSGTLWVAVAAHAAWDVMALLVIPKLYASRDTAGSDPTDRSIVDSPH